MDQEVTQAEKRPRKSNATFFGIIFTLAGAFIFYFFGWPPLKYANVFKSWLKTVGTITKSEVDSWMKDGNSQYEAVINYSYQVAGKQYNSSKITVGGSGSSSSMSRAKSTVQHYPQGKTLDVFYDPGVPDSAVLKPGVGGGDIVLAGIPLIFFIIGLLVLFQVIKPTRSYSNRPIRGGRIDIRDLLKR
ncbi:MAG: DUF3592 domain-containing protein [Bacteroidales bacterium]|nr:DUF3592 domain-containing protein [Bacteroidales bacterium]